LASQIAETLNHSVQRRSFLYGLFDAEIFRVGLKVKCIDLVPVFIDKDALEKLVDLHFWTRQGSVIF
jgi:hypothetical protein